MSKAITNWCLVHDSHPLEYFETKKAAIFWYEMSYKKSFELMTLLNTKTKKELILINKR